jgi:hypothetical protein
VPETATDRETPLDVLLWSLFLGMSWTWCIGMFLPVILVREFGLAGWTVFAIPNVLGAAAMGWVLRTRESSTRITDHHATACAAFSWVTIAFHVFFISWFTSRLFNTWVAGPFLLCFLIFQAVGRNRPRNDLLSAAVTFLLSVILIAFAVNHANGHDVSSITTRPPSQWSDAMLLSTVCLFGFALCPYLDLTFHRACQNTSTTGARLAFSLGFGLFFLLMITFTLWYAPALASVIWSPRSLPKLFALILALHLLVQSALTVVLHARHLSPRDDEPRAPSELSGVALLLASLGLGIYARTPRQILSLDAGELIYRCFMGFYALVFPAYVWLCMIPGRGSEAPTKRHLLVFASAVVIALPMFWIGFIHQKLIWLLPGLLVVLLARVAVPRRATIYPPHLARRVGSP